MLSTRGAFMRPRDDVGTPVRREVPPTDGGPVRPPRITGIDPRGPRFGAGITAVLLAVTVVLGTSAAAALLLGLATVLFAVGAVRGAQGSVQGAVFRRWVRPRLAPPSYLEDPAPPRFSQTVGLVVGATGLVLGAVVPAAVPVAAAVAFVAAFLNAAFGFCLGCEIYLLAHRARRA